MMAVTFEVHVLTIGSVSGAIHMVTLPFHLPTPLARNSCILPGVPAMMHACMSSCVQPGGSFISCPPAAGLLSFDGSAIATVAISAPSATEAASPQVKNLRHCMIRLLSCADPAAHAGNAGSRVV